MENDKLSQYTVFLYSWFPSYGYCLLHTPSPISPFFPFPLSFMCVKLAYQFSEYQIKIEFFSHADEFYSFW